MKKNTLYTVTKGNRPAFMPDINVFAIGGLTNYWQPSNAKMESWTDSWIQKQKSKAYDAQDVNAYNSWIDLQGTPEAIGLYKDSKNAFGLSKQANPFSKMNLAKAGHTALNAGIGIAGNLVGSGAKSLIGNGLSSGVGEGISSIGSSIGGAVGAVNPLLGGIISAGSGIIGGLANAAFGTKWNDDNIKDIEGNIEGMRGASGLLSSATTNNDVIDRFNDLNLGYDFDKSYIGRDGWFTNKVGRRYNKLKNQQNTARAYALHGLMTGAENADQYLDDNVMANFASYGGPMNPYGGALGLMQNDNYINAINNRSEAIMKSNPFNALSNAFGDGGGIHISPSKRGTFTAAASRHNMGVQEFARKVLANKDDYSPAMVKKANFARNSSKWHAFGGELGTNGTDWTNGLLWVDAGGSHQQNPLGGVPVGFDANGTPNFVEEGETIWNDYVFSDRIKVPKAMFHTLGLGGAMKKGITFADASKKLSKESEQRPNDPISMAGLDASLAKLAAVQEAERMKKQMRESAGLGNVAAYGGPVNRYDEGGALNWLKEHYGDKYNEQELNALAKYLNSSVSDEELQEAQEKPLLLDTKYTKALYNVAGSSMFGFGKEKLDNLVAAGISPALAYNIVSKDLRQGDNKNQLYRYMTSLPSSPSASTSYVSTETGQPDVQNTGLEDFLTAMDNTSTLPAEETLGAAANTKSGGAARNASGIIPYNYYINGNDGYSTPTGFKVGENGRAYDYTQNYRDLVRKLTANDIRAWAAQHPDDVSLQSFLKMGNKLENLTDDQWRNGALDEKYGFMHHVANSILEDNTAKAAKTAPGAPTPLERTPGGTAIAEPLKEPEQPKNLDIKYTGLEQEPYQPLGTGLRYAPAVGNAMAVLSDIFNKPDYTYPDRLEAVANAAGNAPVVNPQPIGDYMRYTPFDRMFYANQLQANSRATDRALGNTASPSAAAGLLANAVNTNNALGNLYRQAEEYNLAQRQQVKDFNRRTNMFNSQMGLEAAMANAKNRLTARNLQMQGLAQVAALRDSIDQQYSAARSANLTNLFNSLGNIGRENFIFNQINDDKSRSYRTRRNGTSYYDLLEEAAKKACGGKMKRK